MNRFRAALELVMGGEGWTSDQIHGQCEGIQSTVKAFSY